MGFAYNFPMGFAMSMVATKLLTDGIPSSYPGTNPDLDPEDRFTVFPSQPHQNDPQWIVRDQDLGLDVPILISQLENPLFDLVEWYQQHLSQVPERGIFEYHYLRHYLQGQGINDSDMEDLDIEFEYLDEQEIHNTDDLPALIPLSDSEDENDDDEEQSDDDIDVPDKEVESMDEEGSMEYPAIIVGDNIFQRVINVLTKCQPFPGDGAPVDPRYSPGDVRFHLQLEGPNLDTLEIYDRVQGFETRIRVVILQWPQFSVGKWYAERCAYNSELPRPWELAHAWVSTRQWKDTTMGAEDDIMDQVGDIMSRMSLTNELALGGIQVSRDKYPVLQRNAAQVKGNHRVLPKPLVVKVMVNDHPARALLDSGSLGDFISTTLADQLNVKRQPLDVPLSLQLAVQGSRSKVNSVAVVNIKYQGIDEERTLDVININSYDIILGTPWMYQHQVCIGFNPARIIIGNDVAKPVKISSDTKLMVHALHPEDQSVDRARDELRRYADPLCREVDETDLPPFRAINHTIPLINENLTYTWRPSRCPEVFRPQWIEKRNAYIKSGRWKITSAGNTVPMLLIPKPHTSPPLLRTVVDLQERNKNTHKLTSPLPDMEGMLRRTASKPYRTMLDLKSAYEQIRIVPEHVERSAVTTPDGNMVSLVVQMGDCNAPATHQALMNFLFSSYLGRFVDIYLDDIVIYSDNLEEHVKHVKLVLDILRKEQLYLSRSKLHFIALELKLLGHIIDNEGIRMDAEKVDSVLKWKVPTNRDLLRGFIGSVGYLADDIPGVRIPMGVLSAITGDAVPFRWGYTEQRAFDEVKNLVHHAREHRRQPLNYAEGAPPVWMITDGCSTGISGVISQGDNWKTAKVAAFYSAKLNSAQQNYPVHEIEMFAGIETMLRHIDILQGVKFKWLTDHKGLTHLLNQRNLSGRQARWLEKISAFPFEVVYIAGCENVVADALSRMYSNDSKGTVRTTSEYTYHDVLDDDTVAMKELPILAGMEARIATRRGSRERKPSQKAAPEPESSREFAAQMKNRFVLKGRGLYTAPHTPADSAGLNFRTLPV
jgi:hypothetical protein